MNNISRTLKRWVQNSNMTLDDMAHKVFETSLLAMQIFQSMRHC